MDPVFLQFDTLRSVLYYGAIYGIVVAVAAWIYRDAKRRGSDRALVWFLATLVFTILPVLLYMYLHRDVGPAVGPAAGGVEGDNETTDPDERNG